jgi:hypothetical protein
MEKFKPTQKCGRAFLVFPLSTDKDPNDPWELGGLTNLGPFASVDIQ